MSANSLDPTTYTDVAANTVFNAVLDADALLAWRQDVKTVVNQHATEINTHEAEKASLTVLGHIKIGTSGSIDVGGVYTAGGYKTLFVTHDVSLTGNQAITGVGFTPRSIIVHTHAIDGGSANTAKASFGQSDGLTTYCKYTNVGGVSGIWGDAPNLVFLTDSASVNASGALVSLDIDGITINWAKAGLPVGTARMVITFMR